LNYLQSNNELKVHAYVFMLNHLHLIIQADDVIACLRDFKRHTSREIKKNIEHHEPRPLSLFKKEDRFRFWKPDNQLGLRWLNASLNHDWRKSLQMLELRLYLPR